MGKQFVNTDQNSWTWITRNKKSKPIGNPYHKDLENIATSFYVTNMPPALTSKGLWNVCASHGRLVDAFIANKLSKGGKRFGFIKFLGVKDANSNVNSMSNIWIDIDSMENMYVICRNEGFLDLNIHHVGGYWIWIQFPSSMSCSKFQENESLKRLYSIKRAPMPNFKIHKRILWIEVSGLPLCAWGSMAYKKIASSFGKFLFFEKEESTALSSGRLCISTNSHQLISETVQVDIKNESFEVSVQEIGSWSTKIKDDYNDISSNHDLKEVDHVSESNDEQPIDDFEILQNKLNNMDEQAFDNELGTEGDKKDGLVDLPIGGRSFTWMNKAGTKLSKLDRFLISEDVTIRLPDVRITALDRLWSDHNPILLHIDKTDFCPTPFKLYNSWLLRDGFDNLIKEEWELLDSNLKCHEKFRRLKDKIKQWSNNIKTLERNRKTVALEEINSIEKRIDEGSAMPSDNDHRLILLQEIEKIDKFASMDIIQKAHVKWDIEGDENSKFFHGLINQKRRNQMINGIMVMFSNLPHSHSLNCMDRETLERQVTLEEIKEAVWDCGSSKAPGPDGYSFAFVKKYWGTIQKDLYDFVNLFFASCVMPNGANSSFFTLILKVNNFTIF
ncbi:RNA-directed DNA polymerase, eukaryota, reverse transcriptase zinc-binding domain protein [Tanacetum coccineum]